MRTLRIAGDKKHIPYYYIFLLIEDNYLKHYEQRETLKFEF